MFAIAAINDTDSRGQWEPLAPTKEAQEFHLTQTYHEGLLKLQSKEYTKARELLEDVLKDPLLSSSQVDSTASDGHLLQLRFLALKNLATVFLEQGPNQYENALHCYLQAVEIDSKDSVVWNQLGTLSCSMGLLSTSRWAFEQGLICSPNNWNCMEKLLEILIAIGDEVACLSVAELILRYWPSHSRALYVKSAIEEPEPVPFAPRGIDKLEPKHARLKFGEKRKTSDNEGEENVSKRLNQNIELPLPEVTWAALADAIMSILRPLSECSFEQRAERCHRSGDCKVAVVLPPRYQNGVKHAEIKENFLTAVSGSASNGSCNTRNANTINKKDAHMFEEQTHERRSGRLERLRSHKPQKEESDLSGSKDVAKVVIKFLEPFILDAEENKDLDHSDGRLDTSGRSVDNECHVINFVNKTSKNFGAYHLGHLLLEEVARSAPQHHHAFAIFLELEKLTRNWVCERSIECSLFLAELYYDFGSSSSDASRLSEFMSEVSYHLCKIIESVALSYPSNYGATSEGESCSLIDGSHCIRNTTADLHDRIKSPFNASILTERVSFWVRFYWLSGHVSVWDGNRAKAHEEFCTSLSLLEDNKNLNDKPGSVPLPHCRVSKELSVDKILHQVNLLEVHFLMKETVGRMMERELYLECIDLLSPLLLSCKDVHPDTLSPTDIDEGAKSVELSALGVLIRACESVKPLNVEVYLKCHHRKLQLVMMAARMGDVVVSCKQLSIQSLQKAIDAEGESSECLNEQQLSLVADEIKAISECASVVKSCIDQYRSSNNVTIPTSIVGDIQSLLMAVMCRIARLYLCRKPSCLTSEGHTEQKQKSCFVDAAIGFCKLQHLNPALPIRTRVDLIMAIHDLLAEYGLCCADEDGEGVDGTFLKVAIKHLLALHMRLKSNCHPLSEGPETGVPEAHVVPMQTSSGVLNAEMVNAASLSTSSVEKVASEVICSAKEVLVDDAVAPDKQCRDLLDSRLSTIEQSSKLCDHGIELIEEEREDLESTIDNALDQCFFCLYGLNLRSDASYEDDLAVHKNASRAEYQTKEQCADVFKYILPYAKGSTKTGLMKLRRVLRAIKKHFPQPPEDVLVSNPINKFLDDPNLCEDKLSEEAGSDGFLESILKVVFPDSGVLKQSKITAESCEPYLEVYSNLYYLLAQSEETSATDKWPGFVLTKEGEDFVEQCANLFKYDLLFNPLRFESWQRLANLYDEEVDLLLNDGSKHINVAGWRKNVTLPQRVEISRRRSRRCLLMSLALAKTAEQQCEMHELLALVYYDGLQNVVPLYDQRAVAPLKDEHWRMFCENSLKHFKRAFTHKQDWSHAYYMGKLCEKLGYSPETSLSYYSKAIAFNPTAVDPVYRMHASRLKLLYTCQRDNIEALKICAAYCFDESTKETVMSLLVRMCLEKPQLAENNEEGGEKRLEESVQLEGIWNKLYSDCISAFGICVEGDLKHFHKARHMLAQGLHRSGRKGDLEKAKDELSFCFKSSRSSFTVNMWEIDGMVRKGRRKTPGVSGNKKALEVNLPESSRKFITCIRKYLLFYLQLLEETGDISTLDRAYVSIRADKRFSLCLEDLVPVALWRYIKALTSSMRSTENSASAAGRTSSEQVHEKVFSLFMEQGGLWPEICAMPEIKGSDLTESMLYGYLHHHLYSLELNAKLDTLEGINEKIRKRFKNPKLSNSSCARVCRHASIAWSRSLIINLVLITSVDSKTCSEVLVNNPLDSNLENNQLLCVDVQASDFWSSSFGDLAQEANLQSKWNPLLSRIKNVIVKRAALEHMETANSLLRSAYCFYRDSSSAVLNAGVNMCLVPARLATAGPLQHGIEGTLENIDVSIPRKLLLWAYTLLNGHYTNMSAVVKYCEENAKSKIKRGAGSSFTATTASVAPSAHAQPVAAGNKDDLSKNGGGSEPGSAPLTTAASSHSGTGESGTASTITKAVCDHGGIDEPGLAPSTRDLASSTLPKDSKLCDLNVMPCSGEGQRILSSVPQLHQCNNSERTTFDLNEDCENLDRS